jgi:DNA-binding transcriptional LysR family regulator
MARFRQLHPELRITLNVVNRETLLNHLGDNAFDLAIMGQPPEGLGLMAQPLMDNPLVVIAPPNHPLAGERTIPLRRLADSDFLVREPGSGTRNAVDNFFRAHGLELKVAMEMNANEAIKQAVEVGLGLGIVSLHTVRAELEAGRLCSLDVEDFPIRRKWYLVYRDGKRFSAAAQTFADFLLEDARQSLLDRAD